MMMKAMHASAPGPLLRAVLACALAAACGSAAASADEDNLRLLSCDVPAAARAPDAARKGALDWLNATAEVLPGDAGLRIAGPLRLGKACLQNVTVAGAFGVVMVQGDICNASLDEFAGALAAAGIVLDQAAGARMPGAVLGQVGAGRQYTVARGRLDLRSGEMVRGATPYSFTCMATLSGPQ